MTDPHPRYVCLHYPQDNSRESPGPERSYVLDRWYCHEHVGVFTSEHHYLRDRHGVTRWRSAKTRAETCAAAWNAEHDAWLAADTGEAAQATKGKGSR